ncbi:MAG: EamA family transporter [Gammaproteobacteria bacterium]|nr:EamA family transporter [Gammaproteobacteria bacterium]
MSLLILPFGFELVPPRESVGWVYLAMITLATVTAFVLALQAISRVGGSIFALFLNFEPVIILLLAWIVIGEQLSLERISGILLIVFALFLSHWKVPRITTNTAQAPSD